tara:strand:- start:2758 stop:3552 length:795 start_codon:yes stop_codon:yes gene_type:complete
MNKISWGILFLLLILPSIQAATLHGTIYDLNLDKVNNTVVVINTVPQQQYLSKDGTYSFEVSKGTYTLQAKGGNLSSKDTVKITEEGKFVFDLFLFTSFSEEDKILNDAGGISVAEEKKGFAKYPLWKWLLAIGIILILIGRTAIIKKKYQKNSSQEIKVVMKKESSKEASDDNKKIQKEETNNEPLGETLGDDNFEEEDEEPDYLNNTLDIIKKNEGRITQKKLRKEMMHLSEGKVSLILTELEHKGKIEKIKKGRGNVILLK